jgi:dihydropteroate synthase
MGIVNVTPDSFSDGGRASLLDDAVARAKTLVEQGADILDVGGESSRPGAEPVELTEELRRVIPAIEAIAATVDVPISVDTTKAEVARQALAAGASIVNDITAMTGDAEMTRVVADSGAAVVLMHMSGTPQTMQIDPKYDNVVEEVRHWLLCRVEAAEAQGIERSRIAVDPGIGFGKRSSHNRDLLRNLERFASLSVAVVIGVSRKGFLGKMTGRSVTDRSVASIVSSLAAATKGANILRVHDVAEMADAVKIWDAQIGWENHS